MVEVSMEVFGQKLTKSVTQPDGFEGEVGQRKSDQPSKAAMPYLVNRHI